MQVACITRLVPQKGVHLIRHAIYRTLELGGQFVLLGSSPVPQIQESLGSNFSNVFFISCFLHSGFRIVMNFLTWIKFEVFPFHELALLGYAFLLIVEVSLIFQREFEEICDNFKTHEHARLILKYDEALSHLIYAASDMLIIPSIFEPCGLTQVSILKAWHSNLLSYSQSVSQYTTYADDCHEIRVSSDCQKDRWTKRQVNLAPHARVSLLLP